MGLFNLLVSPRRDVIESKFHQLHHLLTASFGNVKRDTSLVFQWLNYFNQKIIQQDQTIITLNNQLSMLPKREEIRNMVDEVYAHEDLMARLDNLEKNITDITKTKPSLPEQKVPQEIPPVRQNQGLLDIQQRLEKLEQKRATLKEKLIKKITKNSKDYVKSIVISLIRKYNEISALQLKEMIVEEQGLCSKSSFYRLLQEIEEMDDFGVIKKGKEKHYIQKITNKHS